MVLVDLFWVISPSGCAWRLYNKLIKCQTLNNVPKGKKKGKKLKEVSPDLVLPILLNTKPGLQAMAEFITTGRQHDKAKLAKAPIQ
jgi:hypothetical protein